MTCRIIVKQTPMGAVHWQLIEIKTSEALCTSKDFQTRSEALEAVSKLKTIWPDAYDNMRDLTPEGRKISNG